MGLVTVNQSRAWKAQCHVHVGRMSWLVGSQKSDQGQVMASPTVPHLAPRNLGLHMSRPSTCELTGAAGAAGAVAIKNDSAGLASPRSGCHCWPWQKTSGKKTSMTCTEGLFAVLVDSTCFVQDYLIYEVTYIIIHLFMLIFHHIPFHFSSCAIVPSQPRIEKPVFEVTRATGSWVVQSCCKALGMGKLPCLEARCGLLLCKIFSICIICVFPMVFGLESRDV